MSRKQAPVATALFSAFALTGALTQTATAQNCPMPTASDFNVVTLATNATSDLYGGAETGNYGVVQIAVAPDGKVFIAKMCSGNIQVYHPTTSNPGVTVDAGTVPTDCNNEDGLLGIILDPEFATNKWVYVFHTDAASEPAYGGNANNPARNTDARTHLLTRYTYDSSAAPGEQLTNPKLLLRVPRIVDDRPYHAAGGLDITPDRILIIGTGDDTNPHGGGAHCPQNNGFGPIWHPNAGCDAQRTSGNSNDLRGKILRIRVIPFPDTETPEPGIGSTYNIPAGNLWEFMSYASA
jgi:cytochrome c